tara:strand:- start:221 stop:421 length:201 start_codon:yes stop_codon:yes gene_type:complete
MKLLLILFISLAVTGCAVKECEFNPTLEISEKSSNQGKDNKSTKGKLSVDSLKEKASPGGQFTCKY